MSESEEDQTADEPAGESAEPKPRTRERQLFLGGLRGGILGALISGLLAWGLISNTTSQGAEWKAVLPTAAALMAMPFGFVVGAVIGAVAARRKLAALLPCACHHTPFPPPGQPTLVVDGRQILVEPELWRDFFPGYAPPGGTPLRLGVHLRAADSLSLPRGLTGSHAWVVYQSGVWETDLALDTTWKSTCEARYWASGGPKWGPNVAVDVTVRVIQAAGESWDVLVKACTIKMSM